jgi:uncharacterized membrane protein YeaQ/YmgE (transglycosylase-associated protein family)
MARSGPIVLLIASFILAYLGSVVYFLVSDRRSDFFALLKVGMFFLCTVGVCIAIFAFFAAGARHTDTNDTKYLISLITPVVGAVIAASFSWWRLIRLWRNSGPEKSKL